MNVFITILITLTSISASGDIHEKVNELILKNNYAEAEKIAQEYVAKHPKDPRGLCALGCVYRNKSYKSGIQVDASRYLKDSESGSFKFNKDNLEQIFHEYSYFDEKEFKKAEEIYFKIIEIDKNYTDAYFNLLNSYQLNAQYDKYFSVIELFVNNNIKDAEMYLSDLASKLIEKKEYKEAERLYAIIIKNYPDYSYAISDLGVVYLKQGRIDQAFKKFYAAYKKDNADFINLYNLSRVLILKNDFKKAFNFSILYLKNPKVEDLDYYNAGVLALLSGNKHKEYFNTFIEHRLKKTKGKDDFWIRVSREFISFNDLQREDKVKFLEAITHEFYKHEYNYDTIQCGSLLLRYDKKNQLAYMTVTHSYERLYCTQNVLVLLKEIEVINKETRIMPEEDLIYNYARSYFANGDYKKSLIYLHKIKPENQTIFIRYLLGECYYYLKDLKKAKMYHQQNADQDDKDYMYYINLSSRRLRQLQ